MNSLDSDYLKKILSLQIIVKGHLILSVVGNSMFPTFSTGTRIKIVKINDILVGDIIVFFYKGDLLIHRILRINNETIYCKGDNSFRIEKIKFSDVVGKAVSIVIDNAETKLGKPEDDFIELSYEIGKEFIRLGYDREKIIQSSAFAKYHTYLENNL